LNLYLALTYLTHGKEKKQTPTPPTQTRANVGQSVLSRSAKFGIGRKDVGIKALICVGGETLEQI